MPVSFFQSAVGPGLPGCVGNSSGPLSHIFVVTSSSRERAIVGGGIPMTDATVARKPTCPYCGDARIALVKEPHGRDWWLSCYACGQTWQITPSGSIAMAPTGR